MGRNRARSERFAPFAVKARVPAGGHGRTVASGPPVALIDHPVLPATGWMDTRPYFPLAEFDENFSARTFLLAAHEDGQILPPSAAPFRIVIPGDKRAARSARQVASIGILSSR